MCSLPCRDCVTSLSRFIFFLAPRFVWILVWACLLAGVASAQSNVVTYHYDNSRSGLNPNEVTLTPANVNSSQFGKLFSYPVTGQVYAQPLYVQGVTIPGLGVHNVVYVATQTDDVYAFDADSNAGANANPLWHVNMLDNFHGALQPATTVTSSAINCSDVTPVYGITGTPTIDPVLQLMYLDAASMENGAVIHRLHVLDITTGAEKSPGPLVVTASVTGGGDGSSGNSIKFNAPTENNRSGLLLLNGTLYVAFSSHCDNSPYHGWVFAYSASTFALQAIYNTSTNGGMGGIWMSGGGIAADSGPYLYFATGNGSYDGSSSYGDSVMKMTPPANGTMTVADWFTPYDQGTLSSGDVDQGSGGVLLLPEQPVGSPAQHLLVTGGKDGTIYLVNRDNMGHINTGNSNSQVWQSLTKAIPGLWSTPAWWNNNVYLAGSGDVGGASDYLRAFQFNPTTDLLSGVATSHSPKTFSFPAPSPVVSANGTTNAIVWALQNDAYASAGAAILHAYDATNLATEFYNSSQNLARDNPGPAVKFTVPVVINGKVYVGAQNQLSVFGELSLLSSVSVNPTSVLGGNPSTGTVTLGAVAPVGGVVISLSSSNPAVATVPASISISAGATSGTFPILTAAVTSATPVAISATYGTGVQSTSLTALPLLASLGLSPTNVLGGTASTGTVTLAAPAPSGGVTVALSSGNTAAAIVPASVTVAANATTATFTVTTSAVLATTSSLISASYGGTTQTAMLTVGPLSLGGAVSFVRSAGNRGESAKYTVSIAPAAGDFLAVFVWQVEAAATPTITDNLASVYTKDCDLTYNQGNGARRLTVFHLLNTPSGITGVSITPNKPSRGIVAEYSGMPTSGTLLDVCGAGNYQSGSVKSWTSTAAQTTSTDLIFGLADTGFSAAATYKPSGAWTGRLEQGDTTDIDDSYLEDQINAASGSYTATGTTTAAVGESSVVVGFKSNIAPLGPLVLNPAAVVGGAISTGTVTLNSTTGGVVTLSSDTPAVATVPATVTVASGSSSVTFTVSTSAVTSASSATISATYAGAAQAAALQVTPGLSSMSLTPTSIIGGSTVQGTVTLLGPAPATGAVINLSSDNTAAATVPASVTLAGGATSVTFTATTIAVSTTSTANISATYGGISQTTPLSVLSPGLLSLTLNPPAITGGNPSLGSVTLTGPAPASGVVVNLSSDNTAAATVPTTVTVPSGATTAGFTVNALPISVAASPNISAAFGGVTLTATLNVSPPPAILTGLAINPLSVVGGASPTGTLTLNAVAPAGGAVVLMTSTNLAIVTTPRTVTVPAGSISVTFPVSTFTVAAATQVTITGNYNGTASATMTISPATATAVSSVTLNPTSVTGGTANSTGTVTLNGTAPTGGSVVALGSSNTAAATVPVSVTVPANASSATFTVTTASVAAVSSATITASFNSTSTTAALTINPALVTAASFVRAAGNSGESAKYTVSIAPAAGDFLAVFVFQVEGATSPTITDNLGTAYTLDCNLTYTQGYGNRRLTVYHLLKAGTGITGITVTPNKPSRAVVLEYSGMAATAGLDVCGTVRNQTTNVTSWSSNALASKAKDVIIGVADTAVSGNAGYAASGAWAGRLIQHDTVDADDCFVEDQLNVVAGSYTATGTTTTAVRESSVVIGFKIQ